MGIVYSCGIVKNCPYYRCGNFIMIRDRWWLFEVWYLCDHIAGELPVIVRYPKSEARLEKVTKKAIFYMLPKELSNTPCTFFKHNFSKKQEITFLLGKTKEPVILDVMNNRASAEYNLGGLAFLSFFSAVGFKSFTVQLLKQVVPISFSPSVSYL